MSRRFVGTLLLIVVSLAPVLTPPFLTPGAASVPANDRFGFVFVNGAGYNVPDSRYRQAVEAGAGWTRWPFYWPDIERSSGNFDYSAHDVVVDRDRQHGLEINGILLNNPGWTRNGLSVAEESAEQPRVGDRYQPGVTSRAVRPASVTVPGNLYEPVFDSHGNINQRNYWARFVYTTVQRYQGKVKAWEIWNEPDWTGWFWTGTTAEYYRLLQVGYQAAKHADPTVTVLFGGLCHWCGESEFFQKVAQHMAADPTARQNNFYFDVLPIHFYVNPYYAQQFSEKHRATMVSLGTNKPIWINETNVTVCGDNERPLYTCPSGWRGSLEEQSNYIIQIFALAAALNIDRTLIFQLYDDGIGNDSYGIIRNSGNPRPAYQAYQTAARYLNGYQYATLLSGAEYDRVVAIGGPHERVTVLWNKTGAGRTAVIGANSTQATLVSKYGQTATLTPVDGNYQIPLPAATYSDHQTGEHYIGGDPYFLVERSGPLPRARVLPLPALTKGPGIPVAWERLDNRPGTVTYDIQYRVGGSGAWLGWLSNTSDLSGMFGPRDPLAPRPGHTYQFRAIARSADGLVQPVTGDQADAETSIPIPVTGCVRNNRGQGLAGAQVQVGDHQVTTGLAGRFAVDLFPAGDYALSASAAGWASWLPRTLTIADPLKYEFRLAPLDNQVQNAGFEAVSGVNEWWTPEGAVSTSTTYSHSGAKSARLGDAGRVGVSRLSQFGFGFPNSVEQPTLSLMYAVLGTPSAGDRFTITIQAGSEKRSRSIPLAESQGWRGEWLDLAGLNLAALGVVLEYEQRPGSSARVFVDEVTVGSSPGGGGGPVGSGLLFPVIARGHERPVDSTGCPTP